MPEARRTALRQSKKEKLLRLRDAAIAKLERRGYAVRGKTTSEIREILRRRPTEPAGPSGAAAS